MLWKNAFIVLIQLDIGMQPFWKCLLFWVRIYFHKTTGSVRVRVDYSVKNSTWKSGSFKSVYLAHPNFSEECTTSSSTSACCWGGVWNSWMNHLMLQSQMSQVVRAAGGINCLPHKQLEQGAAAYGVNLTFQNNRFGSISFFCFFSLWYGWW